MHVLSSAEEMANSNEIQVTVCVCPITMNICKCGKTITRNVVVTHLSPVNGPSDTRILAHA